ncbi:MAG: PAS domain S-box protein [bacterium]|jgi:PAS domain S-box-containing protein|nr:PAS domain S-box protein [bacterium]
MTPLSLPDPADLGHIFLLQSTLQANTSEEQLAHSVAYSFEKITLISACTVHIHPPTSFDPGVTAAKKGNGIFINPLPTLETHAETTRAILSLATNRQKYGQIEIQITDPSRYSVYHPFLTNTANLIALHIENNRQAVSLRLINETLENTIAERTRDLEEKKLRLEMAVQAGHLGIWEWIIPKGLFFADPVVEANLGFASGAYPNVVELFLQKVEENDRPLILSRFNQIIHNPDDPGDFAIEHRVVDRAGQIRWVECRGRLVRDENQVPYRFIGTQRNITEAKEAALALQASEQRFRYLYETMNQGVVYQDRDGIIIRANPAAAEILGLTLDQVMGRTSHDHRWDAIHEDGSPFPGKDHPSMVALRTGAAVHNVIMGIFHPIQNTYRWILVDAHPEFQPNESTPSQIITTFTDITEIKQIQEEKEKLQNQLIQSQKMEAVGRLAGGVAHDFNNMLGVIIGHADIALMQMKPENPFYSDLKEILKAAQRSADLTRQLLAYARKQTASPVTLNLNATIEPIRSMVQRLIGETIHLEWHPDPELWTIRMDPSQVDQILINLTVNARDAIANTGTITIRTANQTLTSPSPASQQETIPPGEYVLLEVEDTGEGISSQEMDQIFEPFFTTKELGKGTGLGLATVFGIVKQNQGYILVTSEVGRGTQFSIYLPRHKAPRQASGSTSAQPTQPGKANILLVEDEPAILSMTERMLKTLGYTVFPAGTPHQAIEIAKTNPSIHLLITDVVMPGMNGRDLYLELLDYYPNLHSLFMSGYTADVIALHGVLNERVNFIQKPFTMKGLSAILHQILESADSPLTSPPH